MNIIPRTLSLLCGSALLAAVVPAQAASDAETRSMNELRNTVVNLLQGLVQRGVLTRDQAEAMVRDAQAKATADAEAEAAEEAGSVRVPYVPQIVKDEIRAQVAEELKGEVAREVVQTAKDEGWGVPGAMPDWVRNMTWSGDVRFRAQGDLFADDNARNAYLNFQRVNDAGGIGRAGFLAFQNVSEDRPRMAARVRAGFDARLGGGFGLGTRIATGNLENPVSLNSIMGQYGQRYNTSFDLAYLDWHGTTRSGRQAGNAWAGRMRNPWFTASDLMFYQDLTFEGVAANYRVGFGDTNRQQHAVYMTLGAFPIQEVEFASDKWLYAGQLGVDWTFDAGPRVRAGVGYYQFENITGRRNVFDSTLLDYTAPLFLQRGNTVFDIRNDNDPNTNLFALAAKYHLLNAAIAAEFPVGPRWKITANAEFVRNVGYDEDEVRALTGFGVSPRVNGYHGEIAFGSRVMQQPGAWRTVIAYRYTERDATLDAFNDSNLRLGGTDTQGFIATFDYGVTNRLLARLRYLSANEIDGPPLAVDIVQFDVIASF
jgi:hypothetical protein